jgi:diadenosine tetraphosphate (Ap4A) HIT family hydrolase
MALEHLWAGWRGEYIASAGDESIACVFCRILDSGEPDERTHVVWRGATVFGILNAYPYTSGHLMVMPLRHVGELEDLSADESAELWDAVQQGVAAVRAAYAPEGVNVGINLGRAAGAGVLGHLHVHVVPRWLGDSNFMTAVAETRVLPETLDDTGAKIRKAWQ